MVTCQNIDDKQKQIDEVIVNGSTWAAIWHMSWPLVIQMSTVSLASFSDVFIAGKLGSNVQAAIGLCGQIWFFMILITVALSAGTTALVSRFWGARDMETAEEAARQSMIFAFFFGTASMVVGLLICRPLIAALGASPEVQDLGWRYMSIDLLSQLPFTIVWITHAIWRAMGNARVPMMVWGIMTTIILALDYCLCIKPFQMGIAGIGTAWFCASIVGMTLNLVLLRKTRLANAVKFRSMFKSGLSKDWFMRLLKIGLPACVMDLAWVGGCFALFLIFAQTENPTACQAAWAVGFRLEEIVSCLPVYALSTAVATIVGQNLGALKPERAERAGWQVALIGGIFTTVVGLLLFFFAGFFSSLMSTDPVVVRYSTQYFQVLGLCQPFVALWLILFGAMQGAGYTLWPMWASIVGLVIIRLPLAWFLTMRFSDGPMGCWLGLAVAAVLLGLVAVWRFKTGVWKTQKV